MKENKTIENFLKNNNINPLILSSEEAKNYTWKEISDVVSRYGVYKNAIDKNVCIANIVGNIIGGANTKNNLEELQELFTDEKIGYHGRSNSMLKYTPNNILQELQKSFIQEPITLSEVAKNVYFLRDNGRHRCAILKAFYLEELSKCITLSEKEKIKIKYTFPTKTEELDVIKTYSKFIIKMTNLKFNFQEELDKQYQRTGNLIVFNEQEKNTYTDKQLVQLVRNVLKKIPINGTEEEIQALYQKEELFKEYVNLHLKGTPIEIIVKKK